MIAAGPPGSIRSASSRAQSTPEARKASVKKLEEFVEAQALAAIKWYQQKKRSKRTLSWMVRHGAITFTALAGLFPLLAGIWPAGLDWLWRLVPALQPRDPQLCVALFIGVAAALVSCPPFVVSWPIAHQASATPGSAASSAAATRCSPRRGRGLMPARPD